MGFRMVTRLTYYDFDADAVRTMRLANDSACKVNHDYVATEHILIGYLRNPRLTQPGPLAYCSVQADQIFAELRQRVHRGREKVHLQKRFVRPNAMRVTEHATQVASDHDALAVVNNHLMLGMLFVDGCVASQV